MINNIYIHIPFCRQKCNYCSFVSYPLITKMADYIRALKSEIKYFYKNEELSTLYFGGGTPSLLNIEDFEQIINLLNVTNDTEITVEIENDEIISVKFESNEKLPTTRTLFWALLADENVRDLIREYQVSDRNPFKIKKRTMRCYSTQYWLEERGIKVNTKITKKGKIKITNLDNFLLYRIVKVFYFI